MTSRDIYLHLCAAEDLEAAVAELSDKDLRTMATSLVREEPAGGVPALVAGVVTCEAAKRFLAMGGETN